MEPQTTCKNNPDPKEIILNSFSKVFGDSNGIRVFFLLPAELTSSASTQIIMADMYFRAL